MKLEIGIPDENVQNFSQEAKIKLKKQSNRIAVEITDEASRIEEGRILPETNSEITQSNVREAATQPGMIVARKKSLTSKIIHLKYQDKELFS